MHPMLRVALFILDAENILKTFGEFLGEAQVQLLEKIIKIKELEREGIQKGEDKEQKKVEERSGALRLLEEINSSLSTGATVNNEQGGIDWAPQPAPVSTVRIYEGDLLNVSYSEQGITVNIDQSSLNTMIQSGDIRLPQTDPRYWNEALAQAEPLPYAFTVSPIGWSPTPSYLFDT